MFRSSVVTDFIAIALPLLIRVTRSAPRPCVPRRGLKNSAFGGIDMQDCDTDRRAGGADLAGPPGPLHSIQRGNLLNCFNSIARSSSTEGRRSAESRATRILAQLRNHDFSGRKRKMSSRVTLVQRHSMIHGPCRRGIDGKRLIALHDLHRAYAGPRRDRSQPLSLANWREKRCCPWATRDIPPRTDCRMTSAGSNMLISSSAVMKAIDWR